MISNRPDPRHGANCDPAGACFQGRDFFEDLDHFVHFLHPASLGQMEAEELRVLLHLGTEAWSRIDQERLLEIVQLQRPFYDFFAPPIDRCRERA